MADQAFQPHTPSFGDEEFDIGSIGLMNCAPHDEVHHPLHQQHHPQQQHVLYGSSTQMLTHLSHPQDPAALYGNPHPMYLHQQQQQQLGPPQNQDNGYVLHTLENSMNTWSPARNLQPSVPSPLDPHAATSPPSGDTSEESCDDSTSVVHAPGTKRPSPEPNDVAEATGRGAAKKPKPQQQKKKKRRDPHEPQKPVSAYALFFRDTQAAIKGQNPNASFGEVSKIVASMWDALDAESKNIYKRKTEAAKKEYLKALAAYRASVVSKGGNGNATNDAVFPSATPPHQNSNFANYQPNYNLGQPYNSTATVQQPPQSPLTKKTPLLTSLMKEQQQQQQQQSYSIAKPYATQQQPQQIMMHATAQHIQHPAVQQMTNYPQHLQQQQQQHLANVGQSQQGHVSHSMNLNGKHNGPGNLHNQLCIRAGCPNAAVQTSDWENEYCSNECVANHCRDVFSAWVAANPNGPPGYPAPVK